MITHIQINKFCDLRAFFTPEKYFISEDDTRFDIIKMAEEFIWEHALEDVINKEQFELFINSLTKWFNDWVGSVKFSGYYIKDSKYFKTN